MSKVSTYEKQINLFVKLSDFKNYKNAKLPHIAWKSQAARYRWCCVSLKK